MKKSNNIHYVLEIFWLIIAIFLLITGAVVFYKSGFKAAYMFFIMATASGLLYLARRTIRRKSNNAD